MNGHQNDMTAVDRIVSLQSSYVEALTSTVTVFGDRILRRW